MIRNTRLCRALAGTAVAVGALLLSSTPASAFSYADGNLVVTFVKNGYELILNLGASPTTNTATNIDVSTLALPSQFGGSLSGATWTGLSVRAPDLTIQSGDLAGFQQNNIILTTLGSPSAVGYFQIGDAQSQLQPPNGGTAWLSLIKGLGVANGTSIVENAANRLVIQSSLYASYSGVLGLGSNAIANTLTISTAGIVSPSVVGDALPLYELIQNPTVLPSGDIDLGITQNNLGSVNLVPEPGTALLLGAGLLGLLRFGRDRN